MTKEKVIAGEKLGSLDAVVKHKDGKYYKLRSRQEEIRAGLQDWITKYGYSLRPSDLVTWLDSQGVVLKVDGELPSVFDVDENVISAMQYKKKLTGYVKTERLI